jgi:hypothetical protein
MSHFLDGRKEVHAEEGILRLSTPQTPASGGPDSATKAKDVGHRTAQSNEPGIMMVLAAALPHVRNSQSFFS